MGTKDNVHYRLPLILINSGDWAKINLAARVILPVIGVHANEKGEAFPGMLLISKLSGYKDLRTVRGGINSLIKAGLLSKTKRKTRVGRHNIYQLLGNTIWRKGHSYFPIYKDVIEEGYWADLSPSEVSVLVVMGVKAVINNPEAKELRELLEIPIFGIGTLQRKEMIKFSGVSGSAFDYAVKGLMSKGWINLKDEYRYNYEVYLKPFTEDD